MLSDNAATLNRFHVNTLLLTLLTADRDRVTALLNIDLLGDIKSKPTVGCLPYSPLDAQANSAFHPSGVGK